MRRRVLILIVLLGMLLPMGLLTRYSPLYNRVFFFLFGPLWVHIVMHAALCGALAYLVAAGLVRRLGKGQEWQAAVIVLGLVLVVALCQESIQLSYKARRIVADDMLDVGVDLAGGAVGMLAALLRARRHLPPLGPRGRLLPL